MTAINPGEINRKQTIEIGDRVLGHNGLTGYVVAMDEATITIESKKYGRFVSPRADVLTTEFASSDDE